MHRNEGIGMRAYSDCVGVAVIEKAAEPLTLPKLPVFVDRATVRREPPHLRKRGIHLWIAVTPRSPSARKVPKPLL